MDKGGLWAAPLLLLLVLMSGAAAYELENVAKGATGHWEDGYNWKEENLVVDGDDKTCSPSSDNTWRIDLHRDTDLTWIRIDANEDLAKYPPNIRTPGCRSGARWTARGGQMDWVCEGRTSTRYVLILFPTYVRLCEVFVYRGSVVNVALGRPARQSTTFDGTDRDVTPALTFRGEAGLAVDGAPTHVYQDKTCAVTDWNNAQRCTDTPWWTVEFEAPVPVLSVHVFGRGDNVANFGPLVATIGQKEVMAFNSSVIPTHVAIMLLPPITSPSVRLSIPRCSVLQLCEVQAFTLKACLFDATWGENCSKSCPTTCLKNRCHPVTGHCLDGCEGGYRGDTCEIDIDECSSAPCNNGGLCSQGIGSYSCSCLPGFSGMQCETNINECGSHPCRNGARCVDQVNSFTCICLRGYTGTFCETDVNECLSGPCINGGSCEDRTGEYTCSCLPGFVGQNCETNYDECRSYPCRNGGQCTDGINSFTCNCSAGFVGPRCEIDVDECTSIPCQNGGSCRDRSGGYVCSCLLGFSGTHCELAADQCLSSPCLNGGQCINHVTSFSCNCTSDYSGRRCEAVDQCLSSPCLNGGQCINYVTSFTCTCTSGFSGRRCEIREVADQCLSSPCLNGGQCINHVTFFTCTCTSDYSGRRCEDLRQCASSPCPLGSRCVNDGGGFVCICPPGTSGTHCYSVGGGGAGGNKTGGDKTGSDGTGSGGAGKGMASAVQGSATALFTALLLAAVCLF